MIRPDVYIAVLSAVGRLTIFKALRIAERYHCRQFPPCIELPPLNMRRIA